LIATAEHDERGRCWVMRCNIRVGDGFHVYPVFANKAFTQEMSPFLMFDYAAPEKFPPTKKRLGVGEHPHRGFETVTIAFQGEVEHKDSTGNCGVIGPGDVQVIFKFLFDVPESEMVFL